MPTYNHFTFDSAATGPGPHPLPSAVALASGGANTPVDVSAPTALAAALPAATSATGLAHVDTGATLTCVHEPILQGLGLKPVGVINSGTAAGPVQQSLYFARLTFPVFGWSGDLQVVGVDPSGQQVPTDPPQNMTALLGRNLLQYWLLVWNGPGGFWSIST